MFTHLHYFNDNRNGHLCSEYFYSMISSFGRKDLEVREWLTKGENSKNR